MLSPASLALISGLSWLSLGCTNSERAEPERSPKAHPSPSSAFSASVSSPHAFDLLLTKRGIVVVWGRPEAEGGGVMLQELEGGERSSPGLAAPGPALLELEAARTPRAVALLWRERASASDTRAIASHWREGWSKLGERVDLGASTRSPTRGHIALASSNDGALALVRGLSEACEEGWCTQFSLHRFDTDPSGVPSHSTRGLPLSVPAACDSFSTSLVHMSSRWHYGICSQDSEPVTTLFTIQPKPEYARAMKVLPGCHPLGVFVQRPDASDAQAWLVGSCGHDRKALVIPEGDTPPTTQSLGEPKLRCPNNALRIVADDGFELALETPRDHLQALLPRLIAPSGSRAAWSGKILYVVSAHRNQLHLKRYECRDQQLLPVLPAVEPASPPGASQLGH